MSELSRRELLHWFALAPTLPSFLVTSAEAVSAQTLAPYDGPIVVVLRLQGGNDALNTVIPFHDDRYYKARPTIGIAKRDAIPLPGGELGLNPWLTDFRALMDDGHASIVQGVGYPNSSRSHARSTEILETASTADPAPAHGWLGRYVDHACDCAPEPIAGLQFADTLGRTLSSRSGKTQSVADPDLLLSMQFDAAGAGTRRGPRGSRLDYLAQVENDLGHISRQLRRASKGSSGQFDYPDTFFGQSLGWTADMIESGAPTRIYYATAGGTDTTSYDTHSEQLDRHRFLFSELGRGMKAFASQLRRAGHFNRVLLVTFSDFGRIVEENPDAGTDHGDAGLLFLVGGKVRPGLLGTPADLGRVNQGGLVPSLDFRQVYASVLGDWLKVTPDAVLGERVQPFGVVA